MSTLAITNSEIYAELGFLLGISRDYDEWDTQTQGDMDRVLRSGRRRFFSARAWKFLQQPLVISIIGPFQEDSITIAAGVVTKTAGTDFPTDATNYVLAPASGGVYAIASRASGTEITLEDTSLTVATADTEYNLYKIKYDLPSGFGGWEGPVTIENRDGRTINESRNFPDYVVRAFANLDRPITDEPRLFSLTSTVDEVTAIATYQLLIYPLPDEAYTLHSEIRIAPGDTLSEVDTTVISNPVFTECYKECILAAAEVTWFDRPKAHSERFKVLLQEAIRIDNAMAGVRHGRPRNRNVRRTKDYELIVGTVDFSDQII